MQYTFSKVSWAKVRKELKAADLFTISNLNPPKSCFFPIAKNINFSKLDEIMKRKYTLGTIFHLIVI